MTYEEKRINVWNLIWNERGKNFPEDDPIKIDGFDQDFGRLTQDNIDTIIIDIRDKLQLTKQDVLYEFGCGAGMLLSRLVPFVKYCCGTDLSNEMIHRSKKLFSNIKVQQADSTKLPFDNEKFDKILVHSVFQYFQDTTYTEKVMDELLRVTKSGAMILILDLMNQEKKDEYIELRKKYVTSTQNFWKSSIKNKCEHLYFSKEFFEDFSKKRNMKCKIEDRHIQGYINSQFRFDVLLTK